MIRPSVLLFAFVISAPALYRYVLDQLDLTDVLLRFVIATVAVTTPVAVGAVLHIAAHPRNLGTAVGVALVFVAALAAEYKPVPLDESGGRTVSLAFVFLLSTQFLFGWEYAVLAAIIVFPQVVLFLPNMISPEFLR